MTKNLTLHATVKATLYLKGGTEVEKTLEEPIPLWEVPTKITEVILAFSNHEEKLAAYKGWALLRETPQEKVTWDSNDPTVELGFDEDGNQIIIGDTVRRSTETEGEAHLRELDRILAQYEGWTFDWSWK